MVFWWWVMAIWKFKICATPIGYCLRKIFFGRFIFSIGRAKIAITHHQTPLESRKYHHSTQNQKFYPIVSLDFFRKKLNFPLCFYCTTLISKFLDIVFKNFFLNTYQSFRQTSNTVIELQPVTRRWFNRKITNKLFAKIMLSTPIEKLFRWNKKVGS